MIIQSKSGYEPLPEGQHAVTITEVVDLGEQDTPFGKKEQLYITFATANGKSMRKYYTKSVNEKATLYKDVKAITGKAPGKSFDTDTLLNKNLQIVVTHEEGKDGKVRGKIAAFLKAAPGQSTVSRLGQSTVSRLGQSTVSRPVQTTRVPQGAFSGGDGTGITDSDVAF